MPGNEMYTRPGCGYCVRAKSLLERYGIDYVEIDLYALIHRSFDVENLDDPWCARYMDGRKEKIENEVPYIEFDWDSLAQYL